MCFFGLAQNTRSSPTLVPGPDPGPQPPRWRWPCQPLALSSPCDIVYSPSGALEPCPGLPGQAGWLAGCLLPRGARREAGVQPGQMGAVRPEKALILLAELPWGCGACPPLPPSPSQASPLMELRPRSPPSPWLRVGGRPGLDYTWPSSGPGRGSVRGCTAKPAQDELKQPVWEVGFPWGSEGALAPKSSGESRGRESSSQGRLSWPACPRSSFLGPRPQCPHPC